MSTKSLRHPHLVAPKLGVNFQMQYASCSLVPDDFSYSVARNSVAALCPVQLCLSFVF